MKLSWGLGKWLFVNQIMVQVQRYITYWLSAVIAGAAVTGVFAACMSIVAFANPVVFGLFNILAPRSVLAWKEGSEPASLAESGKRLAALLSTPLPSDLQAERIGIPSPFRRLDLTHVDVLALGKCYVRRFPDRSQAILLVGLRTSGSYFAPLLRALFEAEGYARVSFLTLVPGKGAGRSEAKALKHYAKQGYTALIVDDPPHTGGTIFTAFEIARRAGFGPGKLRALIPAHPARRNWYKPLPDDLVVSLEPEHWHKRALL